MVVSHTGCTQRHRGNASVIIVGEDPAAECNTLTEIHIVSGAQEAVIHAYWRSNRTTGETVHILVIEETERVFVGAGRFFAIVDYENLALVRETEVCLFWNFHRVSGYVLVRAELDCFLLSEAGEVHGQVPVDPPWQERVTEEGIEFDSVVYGRRILGWPG